MGEISLFPLLTIKEYEECVNEGAERQTGRQPENGGRGTEKNYDHPCSFIIILIGEKFLLMCFYLHSPSRE